MESVNIILILVIAVILIYILYRVISKKQTSLSPPTPPYDDETNVTKESELTAIENISNGSGITSLNIIQGQF
jgi:cell division protein YceG involved in septum cleavage